MPGTPPAAIDWERLGYQSGQAQAERDGAYYDPLWSYVVNGVDDEDSEDSEDSDGGEAGTPMWQARGVEIARHAILALQPDRPQDAQFEADCQRFAEGFARGYTEALI